MPVLQLVTTGRKSGKPRSILISYVATPNGPALAGTNAGAEYDPAWVKNLQANPEARVLEAGEWRKVRAKFLEDREYDEVWKLFVEADDMYPGYQDLIDRQVPLVVLEGE